MIATGDARRSLSSWWLVGAVVFVAAMVIYAYGAVRGHGTTVGLVMAPLMLAVVLPACRRATRLTDEYDLGGILFAAFAVKLVATYGRYAMVTILYRGGDSEGYDAWGRAIAPYLRRLDFSFDLGAPVPGTGWPQLLTGIVYAVFGTSRFGGFLVFSMLSFIGCWCFFRAFHLAVPTGNHKRYTLLVLFWPTLTFWPSATGKESWMLFSLGITSWGVAQVLARRPGGYLLLIVGITAAAMPRPHIAIVVLAAALVAMVFGSVFPQGEGARASGAAAKLAAVMVLLVAGAILAPKLATFLQIDDIGSSGFADSLEEVNRRTTQGGSEFTPAVINSPVDYPWAFATVLLRPFPYEAHSVVSLIASAEGLLMLGLLTLSIRQMVRLPAALVRNAYVAYSTAFAFMFVYVFAFIGNFGILTRQRSQLLPFVFVVLAVPLALAERRSRVAAEPAPVPAERFVFTPVGLSPPRRA